MKNRKTSVFISSLLLCSGFMLCNTQNGVFAETTSATTVTTAPVAEVTTTSSTLSSIPPSTTTTTAPTTTTTPTTTTEMTTITTSEPEDTTAVDIDVNITTLPNSVVRLQIKAPKDMEYALQMVVKYNKNAIELLNQSSAIIYNDNIKSDDNNNGIIKFAGTNTSVSEEYEYFFEADFEVLDYDLDDGLDVDITEFKEVLGVDDSLIKNPNINVTRTVAKEYLLGDANLNGKIDIMDAVRILQKSKGLLSSFRTADIDGDFNYDGVVDDKDSLFIADIDRNGTISQIDAVYILKYLTEDNLVFLRNENVHSTITDEDGNPIEGVTIEYFRTKTGTKYGSTVSNSDGTFDIKALEGEATITFTKDGYKPVTKQVNIDGYENTVPLSDVVVMSPKSEDDDSTVAVSGTVISQEGTPVGGVSITATNLSTEETFTTTSDEDGSFTFSDGLEMGSYVVELINGDNKSIQAISIDAPTESLELTCYFKTYITGKVVDSDGNPLSGICVDVYDEDSIIENTDDDTSYMYTDRYTDDNGIFKLKRTLYHSGTYTVRVTNPNDENYETYTTTIEVLNDEDNYTIDLGNITLEKYIPVDYTVSGTVVDEDGNPISGVNITSDGIGVTTSDDGKFVIHLNNGTYTLKFSCEGYVDATQTITVSDDAVDLENVVLSTETPIGSLVEFLNSAYDYTQDYTTIYTGTKDYESFKMDGVTYYDGVTLRNGSSVISNLACSFNVSNVDSLAFEVGHVDDTTLQDVTLNVYLDGELYHPYELSATGNATTITVDTSQAKTIRLEFVNVYSSSSYAIGNLSVDGSTAELSPAIPTYDDVATFIGSAYDYIKDYCTTFDGTKDYNAFNMDGVSYTNGLVFNNTTSVIMDLACSFNVDNVDSLSFEAGHVDDTTLKDVTLNVYLDGELYRPYELSATGNSTSITVDTSQAKTVRLEFVNVYSHSGYAIANIAINEDATTINNLPIEEYNSLVNDMVTAINEYRVENGLSEYKVSSTMMNLATQRAFEQQSTGMSHTRPDGSKFSTIFAENDITYTQCAENVGSGAPPAGNSISEMLALWKSSEGHNANLLGDCEYIGVGVNYYDGKYYWVQLFCSSDDID